MNDQNENVIAERGNANEKNQGRVRLNWKDLSARAMRRIVGGGIEGSDIGSGGATDLGTPEGDGDYVLGGRLSFRVRL